MVDGANLDKRIEVRFTGMCLPTDRYHEAVPFRLPRGRTGRNLNARAEAETQSTVAVVGMGGVDS
jgi:hypothetical protein